MKPRPAGRCLRPLRRRLLRQPRRHPDLRLRWDLLQRAACRLPPLRFRPLHERLRQMARQTWTPRLPHLLLAGVMTLSDP